MGNVFNFKRFGLLLRHDAIHNIRTYLMSIGAFIGGLLLLFTFYFMAAGPEVRLNDSAPLFVFVFIVVGILFSGIAFPMFRDKEKTITYLMTPATTFEKFLMEFLVRIVLFLILVPSLFVLIFSVVAFFFELVVPAYDIESISLLSIQNRLFYQGDFGVKEYIIEGSLILLGLVVPLHGASYFSRLPLVKTFASLAVLFFVYFFIFLFFVEVLHVEDFNNWDAIRLMPHSADEATSLLLVGSLILNVGLLIATYFRIKEKEV